MSSSYNLNLILTIMIKTCIYQTCKILFPLTRPFTNHIPKQQPIQQQKLKEIHQQLTQHLSTYNTNTIIKLTHFIQYHHPSLITISQFQNILSKLQPQIHSLNHEHLTLLLQTIKHYSLFNRTLLTHQLLVRKLNSIKAMQINGSYIFRLLLVLHTLNFPHPIILKYVNFLVFEQVEAVEKMSQIEKLRTYLFILQAQDMPLSISDRLTPLLFQNKKESSFIELCYMYEISKFTNLKLKMKYLIKKQTIYDVIFNPYQHLDPSTQTSSAMTQQQQVIQKLQNQAEILKQNWNKKVDIAQVQNKILSLLNQQPQVLTNFTLNMIADIPELQPQVSHYLYKNYASMMPPQFFNTLQHMHPTKRVQILNMYVQSNYKLMNIMQKIRTLNGKVACCQMPISIEDIQELMNDCENINTKQFEAFSHLIVSHISSEHHGRILGRLQTILNEK